MKIEATRAFWHNGEIIPPGSVIEVGRAQAMELIGLRKALGVAEVAPPAAPRRTSPRKPRAESGAEEIEDTKPA